MIDNDVNSMYPRIMPIPKIKPKQITYTVLGEGWNKTCPPGHRAIMTNVPIGLWIEQQPIHMWKYVDLESKGKEYKLDNHFFVSDQLLTWLKMRWS